MLGIARPYDLRWSKVGVIIFIQLASCASILGLYFSIHSIDSYHPWWHWVLIISIITSCIVLAVREVINYLNTAPKIYHSTSQINSYMHRWVSSGGRAVIFSRDMSWAQDEGVRQLLREKAIRNELTVCLEHEIPLSDELQRLGANVVTYNNLGHVPRSRFTIIDFGREGARVAVGVKFGSYHVIQEFRSGSDPFFAVAEDLVKFILSADLKGA